MRWLKIIAFSVVLPLGFAHAGEITVTGQGLAVAEPDMATISLGVSHSETTAQKAMDAVSRDINAILVALTESAISEKDMQTSQISLYPVWSNSDRNGNSRVTGFTASVNLKVKLRDLDRMGAVLAEVVRVGGNQFHGVSLGFQDSAAMEVAARKAAVIDAREKAEQLASAAGVEITGVVSIREGSASSGIAVPRMAEMAMVADGMSIATGESSITQSVTIVFEID